MNNLNSKIHLLTLNVQGVRDKNKQARLFQWSKQQKANILFLQETHITKDIQLSFDRQFNGTVLNSPGTSNSRGVAVLIHSSVSHKVINTHCDTLGRIIILNVEINEQGYSLINVYAPNSRKDRSSFLSNYPKVLLSMRKALFYYAEILTKYLTLNSIDEIERI